MQQRVDPDSESSDRVIADEATGIMTQAGLKVAAEGNGAGRCVVAVGLDDHGWGPREQCGAE